MNILAAVGDISFTDLTTALVAVGVALVGTMAVVAGAAYGVKAIPMGARFISRVWSAIAGR